MKISREVKAGMVVIVAIALTIYGINFLKGTDLFKKDFTLYAVYTRAEGVIEANPIMVHGYKVGKVRKLTLIPLSNGDYKILISFNITEKVKIPVGSKARIVSSDLFGAKSIDLIFSDSSKLVHDGDTLLPEVEAALKEVVDQRIAPLQKKAESLLSSVDSVMQVVQEVMNANVRQSLVTSFENIKTTIISLQRTAFNLDTLTSTQRSKIVLILDKMQSITANIEKSNDKLSNILNNFSNISDSIAKSNIRTTIDHTNLAVMQANQILTTVNSGQGSLGKFIKNDSIFNNLNRASADLDNLVKDLRYNPERYVHFSIFGRKERKRQNQTGK